MRLPNLAPLQFQDAHTGSVRLTSLHAENVLSFGSFNMSFEPQLSPLASL